jgi:hypothetical protein
MKFTSFNPSPLEIQLCEVINGLQPEIEKQLGNLKIVKSVPKLAKDNPDITFTLEDSDGDLHTLVVAFIHRPSNI